MGIGIGGEDSVEAGAGAGAGGGARRGTGKPWRCGAAVRGSRQLQIAGSWGGRLGEGDRAASPIVNICYKPTSPQP